MNSVVREERPIVLGGGFAGIAAAVTLADKGAAPLLLESRPFLGGRARSFHHEESGDEIDNGQHLMMGCYTETLHLLEKLGTRHLVDVDSSLSVEFRDVDRTARLHAPPSLPAPLDVLVGMFRYDGAGLRERMRLMRAGLAARRDGPSGMSVAAWLRSQKQSDQLMREMWTPLVVATMNTDPEEASLPLFLTMLRLSFLKGGQSASLAFPRAGLSELIAPVEEYLKERGGEVRTGTAVRSLQRGEGGEWLVETREKVYATDNLVSALPWHACHRLVGDHYPIAPPPKQNGILSLYLWYDAPLKDLPRCTALLGSEVEWVFNRRKVVDRKPGRYPGLLSCVTSNAGDRAGDVAWVAKAIEEVRERLPEIGGAKVVASQAIHEKRATFAATDAVEALRPEPGEIMSGLTLCGSWTATGLPGTIEGAVRSGVRGT